MFSVFYAFYQALVVEHESEGANPNIWIYNILSTVVLDRNLLCTSFRVSTPEMWFWPLHVEFRILSYLLQDRNLINPRVWLVGLGGDTEPGSGPPSKPATS